MAESILVVDDDRETVELLSRLFRMDGFDVAGVYDGPEALDRLRDHVYDLMITDLQMPRMDGITLLKESKAYAPDMSSIVITGFASVSSAVEAMKLGAYDYISKPFQIEEMRLIVRRALDFRRLQTENLTLKKQLKKKYRFENIVGDHPLMQDLFRRIERVAGSDSTVLVIGESGTGKELVARAIHYNSDRRNKYLIPVNCGAIPETLLESELFGYVKGSFTGATANKVGRFEAADGGSVFLDEVGEMSPALQVKVLRVLQEHEIEPLGSNRPRKVDVRVIAATNADLDRGVEEKTFRADLYYRLNVIPLKIPPLRERRSDIPLLVNHFLSYFREEKGRDVAPLGDDVMQSFMAYDWPGNVRELENLIERLIILSETGQIRMADLPEKVHRRTGVTVPESVLIPDEGLDFNEVVDRFENRIILAALERTGGNKNQAARLLRIKRTTLVEKIKKKGLESEFTDRPGAD